MFVIQAEREQCWQCFYKRSTTPISLSRDSLFLSCFRGGAVGGGVLKNPNKEIFSGKPSIICLPFVRCDKLAWCYSRVLFILAEREQCWQCFYKRSTTSISLSRDSLFLPCFRGGAVGGGVLKNPNKEIFSGKTSTICLPFVRCNVAQWILTEQDAVRLQSKTVGAGQPALYNINRQN